MSKKKGDSYENVAQVLLNEFAEHFGLERVEKKQKIVGVISKRRIEIDAKGVKNGGIGFVVIECKAFSRNVEAEKLEALAYRIEDAGADGGIIVSPMDLQEGAKQIAAAEDIVHVKLAVGASMHEYVMQFLNQVMIGLIDNVGVQEKVIVEVETKQPDGSIKKEVKDL
jgi:hypothetical protein